MQGLQGLGRRLWVHGFKGQIYGVGESRLVIRPYRTQASGDCVALVVGFSVQVGFVSALSQF